MSSNCWRRSRARFRSMLPGPRERAPRVGQSDRRRLAREKHTRQGDETILRDQPRNRVGLAIAVSLLYYLFFIRSAGSIRALDIDAQERRFKGARSLSRQKSPSRSATLWCSDRPWSESSMTSERESRWNPGGSGSSARRVVVAMMPSDTRRIEFIPELPPGRRGLVKGWRGQPAVKVNAIYDRPFWRDDGP